MMPFQPHHYYDMTLLALMWLTEDRSQEGVHPRAIPPIFRVLEELGVITPNERQAALNDRRFQSRLEVNLTTAGRQMQNRHLAVQLPAGASFNPQFLLTGGGKLYRLFITPTGVERAKAVEEAYTSTLRRETFLAGWDAMRARSETAEYRRRVLRRQQKPDGTST